MSKQVFWAGDPEKNKNELYDKETLYVMYLYRYACSHPPPLEQAFRFAITGTARL